MSCPVPLYDRMSTVSVEGSQNRGADRYLWKSRLLAATRPPSSPPAMAHQFSCRSLDRAQADYVDAPGASAMHDDYDPELAEPPLTPHGLPLDAAASRARAAGEDFGPPRSNPGHVGPPLNCEVPSYMQSSSRAALPYWAQMPPHPAATTETCATQLEPEEVEAAAPAPPVPEASLEPEEAEAAAPAGSCAGAWEIKDSEDEDSEAEILQIQEAVAEARARLHQLQLDAGVYSYSCDSRKCLVVAC